MRTSGTTGSAARILDQGTPDFYDFTFHLLIHYLFKPSDKLINFLPSNTQRGQ